MVVCNARYRKVFYEKAITFSPLTIATNFHVPLECFARWPMFKSITSEDLGRYLWERFQCFLSMLNGPSLPAMANNTQN